MSKRKNLDLFLDEVGDASSEMLESSAEGLIELVAKINIPDCVPVIGTIRSLITGVRSVHDLLVLKRIKKLREIMLSSEEPERAYAAMDEKDKHRLADLLISELMQQTSDLQAEALGYLAEAYLLKKIEYDDFVGVAAEIKRVNPIVFGGENRKKNFQEANGLIYGPYDLLPNAFTSDHSPLNGDTRMDPSCKYLTNLGKLFYYLVYEKMVKDDND